MFFVCILCLFPKLFLSNTRMIPGPQSSPVIFFLKTDKQDHVFSFTMILLGTDDQCEQYLVELVAHDGNTSLEGSKKRATFSGEPCAIDMDKKKMMTSGLVVNDKMMKKMYKEEGDKFYFSLSFKICKA